MTKRIELLERENSRLLASREVSVIQEEQKQKQHSALLPYRWESLHRIGNQIYLNEPSWLFEEDISRKVSLQGTSPLSNLDGYLDRHPDIAFIVYKDYEVEQDAALFEELAKQDVIPVPKPSSESLQIVAPMMKEALQSFAAANPDFNRQFPELDLRDELEAPYIFWYYCGDAFAKTYLKLSAQNQGLLHLLRTWIEASCGKEYANAQAMLEEGLVTPEYMQYLFRLGDVLVSYDSRSGHHLGYMVESWASSRGSTRADLRRLAQTESRNASKGTKYKTELSWVVRAWVWEFNGTFSKEHRLLDVKLAVTRATEQVKISELSLHPLKFAGKAIEERLEKRGRMFWSCRDKRIISYVDEDDDESNSVSIDPQSHSKFHH